MRVGQGFDVHAFDETRPLILGGVEITGAPGLAGHSDADALSHAIADALLGAANLGDLGARFPDTDEWAGASSLAILEQVAQLLTAEGWAIGNIDSTVVAARPRLAPFKDQMRARIAEALGVDVRTVSVKATTTDGLGYVGRGEGIAAHAVALLTPA
jgi:2-C-methyl-D-erythritol 2,4-cyclodiphosphate synthase